MMVSNRPKCQIVLLAWSVSNCHILHDGVKLSHHQIWDNKTFVLASNTNESGTNMLHWSNRKCIDNVKKSKCKFDSSTPLGAGGGHPLSFFAHPCYFFSTSEKCPDFHKEEFCPQPKISRMGSQNKCHFWHVPHNFWVVFLWKYRMSVLSAAKKNSISGKRGFML